MKRKEYSLDLRERVVNHYLEHGNIAEAAKHFKVPNRSLRNWIKRYKETGSCASYKRGPLIGVYRKLPQGKALELYMSENSDLTLKEIALEFNCSDTLVCDRLAEEGITRKKKTFIYTEQDQKKEMNFMQI